MGIYSFENLVHRNACQPRIKFTITKAAEGFTQNSQAMFTKNGHQLGLSLHVSVAAEL